MNQSPANKKAKLCDQSTNGSDRISIQRLGDVAAATAIPVIGCAEGIGIMEKANTVGMIVTAYDHAMGDRYSECKKRKTEMGYKCMAPVFPKVSLTADYQHWTSALKYWLDTHYQAPDTHSSPPITNTLPKQHLVIQRCRGSEVAHTFEVWTNLLVKGRFFRNYEHTTFEREEVRADDELTLLIWHLKYNGQDTDCKIFFRGGWEPHRICHLPPQCTAPRNSRKDQNGITVFLLGTCCRFQNCEEGDLLVPNVSIRYDCKRSMLNTKAEPNLPNWFDEHKADIWSYANQSISQEVIMRALKDPSVEICGYDKTKDYTHDYSRFAAGWERIKSAVHIQLTDIFQIDSEDATFTQASLKKE